MPPVDSWGVGEPSFRDVAGLEAGPRHDKDSGRSSLERNLTSILGNRVPKSAAAQRQRKPIRPGSSSANEPSSSALVLRNEPNGKLGGLPTHPINEAAVAKRTQWQGNDGMVLTKRTRWQLRGFARHPSDGAGTRETNPMASWAVFRMNPDVGPSGVRRAAAPPFGRSMEREQAPARMKADGPPESTGAPFISLRSISESGYLWRGGFRSGKLFALEPGRIKLPGSGPGLGKATRIRELRPGPELRGTVGRGWPARSNPGCTDVRPRRKGIGPGDLEHSYLHRLTPLMARGPNRATTRLVVSRRDRRQRPARKKKGQDGPHHMPSRSGFPRVKLALEISGVQARHDDDLRWESRLRGDVR